MNKLDQVNKYRNTIYIRGHSNNSQKHLEQLSFMFPWTITESKSRIKRITHTDSTKRKISNY
jgi:hypothetical protein